MINQQVSNFSIMPSALAYLFGDMLEDVFAAKSRLSLREKLPCREVKIKRKDLATAVLVSAIVYLAKRNQLSLEVHTKGRIIKSKFVLVTPLGQFSNSSDDSFEGQILASISDNPKYNDVRSIVWRLWSADSASPWSDVIQRCQKYLLGQGYFSEQERHGIAKIMGKKLVPQCEKILPLQAEADALRNVLADFRAANRELYERLWKDVGKGIASRQEQEDIDMDDDF